MTTPTENRKLKLCGWKRSVYKWTDLPMKTDHTFLRKEVESDAKAHGFSTTIRWTRNDCTTFS